MVSNDSTPPTVSHAMLASQLPVLGCAVRRRASSSRAQRRAAPAAVSSLREARRRRRLRLPQADAVCQVIEQLCAREDLSEERAEQALSVRSCLGPAGQALTPCGLQSLLLAADPAQTAAFLVLLRAKGETAAEIAGLARAMRNSGVRVDAGPGVLDIVGTGGDRRGAAPAE